MKPSKYFKTILSLEYYIYFLQEVINKISTKLTIYGIYSRCLTD